MNGIELTQESNKPVWISLASIALIKPYMGFDGKETGTQIVFGAGRTTIRVTESYSDVIEKCDVASEHFHGFNLAE